MNQNTELSLEQEFKLQVLKKEVHNLSKEQAQEYLLEMFKQMMFKDLWIAQMLKNK